MEERAQALRNGTPMEGREAAAASPAPLGWRHLALVALALATAPGHNRAGAAPAPVNAGEQGAASPADGPPPAWKDVLVRSWNEASDDNLGLVAAGVAFYGFLALVPLLGAIVLGYGLLASPASLAQHIAALARVLPAEAARLIGDQLAQVIHTSGGKKGIALASALLLSLFSARGAVGGIITALNIAYEEKEQRGFLVVNLLALGITAAGVAFAVLGLAIVSLLGLIHVVIPDLGGAGTVLLAVGSYGLMGVLAAAAAATLYRFGPSGERAPWRWITPGTVLFALAAVVLAVGFGFYAANFGHYGATYGSLSGVIVLLTLMYLSAYALLMGAEVNSELERGTPGEHQGHDDGPPRD